MKIMVGEGIYLGHEYVDFGLSVIWAKCNVGASNPLDCGGYYAWGEIRMKSEYTAENCLTNNIDIDNIMGVPTYDVARARWGGMWRLPTMQEIDELINKCSWNWLAPYCSVTTKNGAAGYLVTGRYYGSGGIFLPAAGWCSGEFIYDEKGGGNYWCATPDDTGGAYFLDFCRDYVKKYRSFRSCGFSVRPVAHARLTPLY